MSRKCFLNPCPYENLPGTTFHSVPDDPKLKRKIMEGVRGGRSRSNLLSSTKICSNHFTKDSFCGSPGTSRELIENPKVEWSTLKKGRRKEMSDPSTSDPSEVPTGAVTFPDLVERLSDPELDWTGNWEVIQLPEGVCFCLFKANEDFTDVQVTSKVLISSRDMTVTVSNQFHNLDPNEASSSLKNRKIETWTQLCNILDYFSSKSSVHSGSRIFIQEALKLLEQVPDFEAIVEPIREQLRDALEKIFDVKEEVLEENPLIFDVKTEMEIEPDFDQNSRDEISNDLDDKLSLISNQSGDFENPKSRKKRIPKSKEKNSQKKPKLMGDNKTGENTWQCEVCDKIFKNKVKWRHHQYAVHSETLFCDRCGKEIKTRSALQRHMLTHMSIEKRAQKCPHCDIKILPESLRRHIRTTHMGLRPHLCSICTKTFTTYVSLQQHLKAHEKYKDLSMRLECPKCKKVYQKGAKIFQKHLESCDGVLREKPDTQYGCFLCDKHYPSKLMCAEHLAKKHEFFIADYKKFCFKCQKEVEDPVAHSKSHNCIYGCELCGVAFRTQTLLDEHKEKKHRDGGASRTFKCDLCPSAFKCNSHLQSHKKNIHLSLEEKNFKCDFCDKRFGLKSHLNTHINLVHTLTERFSCNYCGESFRALRAMKSHCKSKHGEDCAYPCPDCPEKLKTLNDLKSHREMNHGETILIHKYHSL